MSAPPTSFTAACVQMRSSCDVAENIAAAKTLVREAASKGADLVMTPEMTSLLVTRTSDLFDKAREEKDDEALAAFRALAKEKGIWLLLGSLPIRLSDAKVANRSFLLSPEGEVAASYDKIHMFDVDLEGGESYRESRNYEPGAEAVLARLPWGRMGAKTKQPVSMARALSNVCQCASPVWRVKAAGTERKSAPACASVR